MNIVCLILGLNIYVIFILKREWLLQLNPYVFLLATNVLLFVAAHILEYQHIGNRNFVAALKIPAPQQILFMGFLVIYRTIFHKDPRDTLKGGDWKKMKDGVFNFIFVVASAIPTILALDNTI